MAEKTDYTWLWFAGIGLGLFLLPSNSSKPSPGQDSTQRHESSSNAPKTPTDYIKRFYSAAKSAETSTGVPASVVIAQSGIESGWGKHAPGFNFFGIKPGSKWTGETQVLKTWECGKSGDPVADGIQKKGNDVFERFAPGQKPNCDANMWTYHVNATFRKYGSPEESFADYGKFLLGNKRYHGAFDFTNDPPEFGRKVVEAGYGNGANYANVLHDTIVTVQNSLSQLGISGCTCQHRVEGSVKMLFGDPHAEKHWQFMAQVMENQ